MTARPIRLAPLYVPGDRPDRFGTALAAAGDVICDLEDAVAPAGKDQARRAVVAFLTGLPAAAGSAGAVVEVRVNALDSPWGEADLHALAGLPGLAAVRLPKVESARTVHRTLDLLGPGPAVHCLVETAAGVEAAFAIAGSSPRVAGIALGEADLISDLGVPDGSGLGWARGRVVVAARAAGLPSPLMSAYPNVSDVDGLAASCRQGGRLGFVGRAAIHPRQVPVIVAAFAPGEAARADATAVLAALQDAARAGRGVVVLPDGRMVDPAMVGRARRVLAVAEAVDRHRARPDRGQA
ncbi:MAG: citrate lyase subunit beta / citryl-CoA lyase [Mycobacteriales bacterium]